MRVLFLTDSLSDLDGVGRYTVRLIQALERAAPGFEARVLLARKHRPTSAEVPARWDVEVALPPDYFFHMSPLRFACNAALCIPRIALRARGVDLVHAIKDYPHSWAALRGARLAGKPVVATAHGTYSVQPLLTARHAARARATYRDLDALIAVSGHTRDRLYRHLREADLPRERVHVIPNAVSAAHYAEARPLRERAWSGKPFTLSIGEVKERKGHHLSLAAFCAVSGRHPDLQHVLVGNAVGDAYHRSLLEIARRAGVADRVHFVGNVDEDEKVALLQNARVFLHTPVDAADGGFEGFGIVYLEAAACGTPSIGTRGSGAEDAIDDGVSGLLVAQESEAVRAALERVLDDPALRERLGAGGRAHAARSSWDDNARAVLRVYASVMSGGAR
ncbi:MAG: glycosyltransferase family 4 protein [Planctomycetota bacterium]|nr:glycosyltransferase family 4 protein [Planctomycetota bacterium]